MFEHLLGCLADTFAAVVAALGNDTDDAEEEILAEHYQHHGRTLVQERPRLLQEQLAGRVSEATNRNLFLLSIVTTTLLPITLITGVFGMNVGGLPWLSDSGGFWWVVLLMIAAAVTVLMILRRRSVL